MLNILNSPFAEPFAEQIAKGVFHMMTTPDTSEANEAKLLEQQAELAKIQAAAKRKIELDTSIAELDRDLKKQELIKAVRSNDLGEI